MTLREKSVREHLRAVYGTLALGLFTATLGAILHIFTKFFEGSLFIFFLPILFMTILSRTPHSHENERKRLMYFLGFALFSGISSGPLFQRAMDVDRSIIMTAFLSSSVIFGCFTLAALLAPSTKYLYLGGTISSALVALFVTAIFFHSEFMHTVCLWGGLAISCALVLYDTQLICEKRRRGDNDYVWHTIELFIDFLNLFDYIVSILKEKKVSFPYFNMIHNSANDL
ncbi:unnamed protein product [Dracunculus medinensis]|uniref:Bax inhibitor 1 n=1 Tax=Dracunculus medinensis TaxID=318479 RepID=A0A0N4UQA1_DRAME|nr:unnamed protein product [Dracunculus medinensis]